MGGFHKRLVRNVKQCRPTFTKISRQVVSICSTVTDNSTVTEIKCMLNSRPLVYVDSEIDVHLLTPAHFLPLNTKVGFGNATTNNEHDCLISANLHNLLDS